jgi:hypothetical protein
MRLYELECSHGIGHSSGVHGCDGCCAMLTKPATDAERERITKLLEQDVCPDWSITCCDGACAAYKDAIALIKGEQK